MHSPSLTQRAGICPGASTSRSSAVPLTTVQFGHVNRSLLVSRGPSSHRGLLSNASPMELRRQLQKCNGCSGDPPGAGVGLMPELREAITKFNNTYPVVLYMKGTKVSPACGFSNTCVQILNDLRVPFETVNVLEDERIRFGMKEYSQWPTFPQLYIRGEFYGGCDIVVDAYKKGQLAEALEVALNA